METTFFSKDKKEANFLKVVKSTKNKTLMLLANLREKTNDKNSKNSKNKVKNTYTSGRNKKRNKTSLEYKVMTPAGQCFSNVSTVL